MKKILLTAFFVVTFFALTAVQALAVVNDTVKVGLRYGSSALFSANLENAVGSGYEFGYYGEDRSFTSLGWTEETAISMTAAGTIHMDDSGAYSPSDGARVLGEWHVQLGGFRSYDEALDRARSEGGWPAWVDREYVVRAGCFTSRGEAEAEAGRRGGQAVCSSSTGVIVTRTRTADILFEFDCGGALPLGVRPSGGATSTWFKGCKYGGGFEYPRASGGNLSVVNVIGLEDYVKGVIPYEMGGDWPLAALEAQAVCARTFVQGHSKHLRDSGFDVCNGADCQVYNGHGSGGAGPSAVSDQAVENTAGECIYYQGTLVQDAVYHSSDGGATEDGANVWGTETGYLKGKIDPYEAQTAVPNNSYSVTYTASELSWILDQKGYSVGTVQDVYVSEYTPVGNVKQVTFVGTNGTRTFTGDACRTIFYSSTYKKSVSSLRFDINGGRGSGVYVNGTGQLASLDGASVISGGGSVGTLSGNTAAAISSSGTVTVSGAGRAPGDAGNSGSFTITGSGSGHNVGMSQYGARAMAEQGHSYRDILNFYYTDITIG